MLVETSIIIDHADVRELDMGPANSREARAPLAQASHFTLYRTH